MIFRVILTLCLIANFNTVFSQDNWDLAKDKNGIKVYTSKEGASKFKSIKVEAVMTGTLDKLVKILLDAGSNKNWIYRTNESYPIKRINAFETLSYTETSLPWPASNRDIPINVKLYLDAKANSLKVMARGVPKAIPEKKGIVRIPYFNSSWDVKYDGKSKLNIKYFLEMDPGGSIPAWVTNMFVARGPFETFNNLSDLLKM